MNSNQQSTLNQAIKLLQSLLKPNSQSNSSHLKIINIPDYDSQIQTFYQKGSALQPQISLLTQYFKKASTTMKSIISYSDISKKFSPTQEQKLKNIFINLSNDIDKIMTKNANFVDQCKAVKQILSSTFWVFVQTPQFIIKGAIQGADFNALKFQKKKVKQHNEWWASVSSACKALQKFVAKNYSTGLNFQFNGQNKWDQIITGNSSTNDQSSKPEKQPTINKIQETNKQPVQKQPKKQMVGLNWEIRNFENQPITLSNQVQMKHNIFIQHCNGCNIKIDSKFKSLNLNKCQNVTLFIKSCVSGVELMNCKNLTVVIKQKTPSLSVDKCEKVNLVLNDTNIDTDIVSCKASELNVNVEKSNGQEIKPYLISDQLITKWNQKSKKFETKVYDKFL